VATPHPRVAQRAGLLAALAPLVFLVTACTPASSITEDGPPQPEAARRATPVQRPGAPNLYRVTDRLYRGAQPTAEGVRELKAMGVATVLSLRSAHSDADEIGDADVAYEHIWFRTWHPEDEDVIPFLDIVTDPENAPVFVHCRRGADRTGMMCAVYRVVVCRWTREEPFARWSTAVSGSIPGCRTWLTTSARWTWRALSAR